jgi:hypothetical protein
VRPAFLSAVAISAAVIFAGTGRAQSPNPHVGNWKGNIAKSTAAPGTAAKSNNTRIEAAGDGVHVIVDTEYVDGTKRHWEFTAKYDGKDTPITGNGPYGDTAALTRVDARSSRTVYKNHGTVTVNQTAVVSADGRTRTVTSKGKNVLGQAVDNVNVYDRQ